ncbi:hypothetical protein HQ81_0004 [Dickeya phage phiDP23.1]|uniref:Tail length tape measure protein n=4 Tax=Aglimvirinae TaxID=2169530 RepID=A0A0N6YR69_9CAUD|nr:hypothetical protein HQ80_0029 [Dickeya phage phiD3]AIM51977.1 hypothetical protein HQ81_0004 [Dickeya phage phiDP23.1]AYN55603.1 putative tail length tape measure [Dickeya phage Kamild]
MADPAEKSQSDVVKVLDKIKTEMMQRKQLRAQNETNKQLERMNKNLSKLESASKQEQKADAKPFEIRFPTVTEIVQGFARMSPIFTRDFGVWMKDSIDTNVEGNRELENIAGKIERLGDITRMPADDTSVEYLNLISDQLKASNDDSLKRMDEQGLSLVRMGSFLNMMDGVLIEIRDDTADVKKNSDESLVRLSKIEDKLGRVGGHIVGALTRIFDEDQKWREKDEMRRGETDKETGGHPQAGSVIPKDDDQKDDSSGIGAAVAAMLGLNALKGFLLKPFKIIGGVVGTFLGMFSKLGDGISKLLGPFGKVFKFLKVGPLALLSMIWDFGKGFINAKEILGKGTVTIVDRVRAGISELVGGFGDLFDWVSKIFGFDTEAGETLRKYTLMLTEAPARWLNGIVDWISNDLFAGIGRGTSLTDIPGKLADNLQSELMKLVDWFTGGISGVIDEGMGVANKVIDDIKKGFADNVKKPFFNMLNAITNAMFDIVDKFVSIIPDSLGGAAAKQKMDEARQSMLIGTDENPSPNTTAASQPQTPPQPNIDPQTLTPMPSGVSSDYKNVTDDRYSQMKEAYSSIGSSLVTAKPAQGRAISNVEQVQGGYANPPASVVMPVQQNVDASKKINTTNNFNSSSLEPENKTDSARILWDW